MEYQWRREENLIIHLTVCLQTFQECRALRRTGREMKPLLQVLFCSQGSDLFKYWDFESIEVECQRLMQRQCQPQPGSGELKQGHLH